MSRRLPPYRFAGGTAVLTGAASGIGEHLAHGLAARGSDVVLLDRDDARLAAVADAVRRAHPGVDVATLVVDLADADATVAAAEAMRRDHPRITLLINNAGVALGGLFEEVSAEEFDWVLDVNLRAPVLLTRHLLPALTAQPGGHLVNVSSLFGLIAPVGQAAYATSKFALRGFSEVLRGELAAHGTGVTTVHPGGIATRIAQSARLAASAVDGAGPAEAERRRAEFGRLLTYPPEKAAAQILDAVQRRRARLLIAASAIVPDLLARLFPVAHAPLLERLTALATRSGPLRTGSRTTR
jgi:short-subunit dehydrogenase